MTMPEDVSSVFTGDATPENGVMLETLRTSVTVGIDPNAMEYNPDHVP